MSASVAPGDGGVADQLSQMFPGAQIEIEGDAGALDAGTLAAIQSALGDAP